MNKYIFIIFILCAFNNLHGQTDPNIIIGATEIEATPLNQGTKFADPNGSGTDCTLASPCNFITAIESRIPGDVIFLREGIYPLNERLYIDGSSGTEENPIIIESYPNEHAVINGQRTTADEATTLTNIGIMIRANYIYFRNIEIKQMSRAGIQIGGSYNRIEGCHIHHNLASGILIYDMDNFYQTPYVNGFNVIKNNIINDNSDAGIPDDGVHNDGDNADGIAVSSGKFNVIENNTVYHNSDDGIDCWRSNDTKIGFNKVYNQGLGNLGNGNGIKTGGNLDPNPPNGLRAYAYHNIVFGNRSDGFDFNAGNDIIWEFNTSYQNQGSGFMSDDNSIVKYNIENSNSASTIVRANHIDNSWQRAGIVSFISTDPNSPDFLKPIPNGGFDDIGAYAIESSASVLSTKINEITIYPNPLNGDILYFKTKNYIEKKVQVFNTLGCLIFKKTTDKNQINLDFIPKGAYLITIEIDGIKITKKLLKR